PARMQRPPEMESSRMPSPTTVRRLARAEDGGVAMIFGLALLPMMGMAGLAVDSLYAMLVREQLSHAVDAAALAGASAFYQPDRNAQAEKYFESNFTAAPYRELQVRADENATSVTVSARASVPAHFMQMFGAEPTDVSATATAQTLGAGGMELA